jgi:hypothetical protein
MFDTPGAYKIVLFTMLTNMVVGYAVGVLMKLFGPPPIFSQEFVGPVLLIVSGGAGGGGPGSLLFWIFL